jgi:hypothetical protein
VPGTGDGGAVCVGVVGVGVGVDIGGVDGGVGVSRGCSGDGGVTCV